MSLPVRRAVPVLWWRRETDPLAAAGMDRVIENQVASENVSLDDVSEGATVLDADLVVEVLDEQVVNATGDADPHLRRTRDLS